MPTRWRRRSFWLAVPLLVMVSACAGDRSLYQAGYQTEAKARPELAKAEEADAYRLENLAPGAGRQLDRDEAGIWMMMEREEGKLKTSGNLIRDPALNAYVKGVVCKVAGEYCSDIRVYVVRLPYFNASMTANGVMLVWSGLLVRVHSEAELAAVIGHEVAHYLRRHSLQQMRDAIDKTAAMAVFQIVAGAAGVPLVGDLAVLATLGSLQSFSRDQEREADGYGLLLLQKAGYAPAAASRLWGNLNREREAKKDKEQKDLFLASHPDSAERQAALKSLLEQAAKTSGGDEGEKEFQAAVGPWRNAFLGDEVNRRSYETTLELLKITRERIGDLGALSFFEGEVYRLRNGDGDTAKAIDAYGVAAGAAPPVVEAHRSLGMLLNREGRREESRDSYRAYIELNPTAPDRRMIEFMIGGGA